MRWFSLEQDRFAARVDLGFYSLAAGVLAAVAWTELPAHQAWRGAGWVLTGVVGWTLAEYVLHRFVLHGLQPFKRWHALHHARPQALIATPTLLTAVLFAVVVMAPAAWLLPIGQASALLLGVMAGYPTYILLHHAVHHAGGARTSLRWHRRWHGAHHRVGASVCYGVSVPLWDFVFRSARPRQVPRTTRDVSTQP